MQREFELIEFVQRGDDRGHLVAIEGLKNIPFEIKRVFYIYGSDGNVIRGQHANRKSEFVLINIAGQSKVRIDDGHGNETIVPLEHPHIGLYIPRMLWKEMYGFSVDSVLLVLSSEYYDADEYIRDYDTYVTEIRNACK